MHYKASVFVKTDLYGERKRVCVNSDKLYCVPAAVCGFAAVYFSII